MLSVLGARKYPDRVQASNRRGQACHAVVPKRGGVTGMKLPDKRVILGVALGAALLLWFLSDVHWGELAEVLGKVQLRWVIASAAMMMLEWTFRGARWWILLRHVDKELRLWTCVSATWIGLGLNSVLPLRGGDLVRPALVAADRNLPYSLTMSTTLIERLFDWGAVCGMLSVMFAAFPAEVIEHSAVLSQMKWWSRVASVVGVVVVVGTFSLLVPAVRRRVLGAVQKLPLGVRGTVQIQVEQVLLGVETAGNPWRIFGALGLTCAVWATGILSALYLFRAMELPLGLDAAVFVEGALTLSVALPQAPGYLGVFQVAMEETLKLFAAPVAVAKGAALVFWAICYLPVTAVGLLLAWRRGLPLSQATAKS